MTTQALWTKTPSGRKQLRHDAKVDRLRARVRARLRRARPLKRIATVSERRRGDVEAYRREAKAFVQAARKAGHRCPVVSSIPELRNGIKYGWPISATLTEVHHRYGRQGKLLRWKPGWLAVSKQGHRWIHAHPEQSRERGWIAPQGQWNNQTTTTTKGQ